MNYTDANGYVRHQDGRFSTRPVVPAPLDALRVTPADVVDQAKENERRTYQALVDALEAGARHAQSRGTPGARMGASRHVASARRAHRAASAHLAYLRVLTVLDEAKSLVMTPIRVRTYVEANHQIVTAHALGDQLRLALDLAHSGESNDHANIAETLEALDRRIARLKELAVSPVNEPA